MQALHLPSFFGIYTVRQYSSHIARCIYLILGYLLYLPELHLPRFLRASTTPRQLHPPKFLRVIHPHGKSQAASTLSPKDIYTYKITFDVYQEAASTLNF